MTATMATTRTTVTTTAAAIAPADVPGFAASSVDVGDGDDLVGDGVGAGEV